MKPLFKIFLSIVICGTLFIGCVVKHQGAFNQQAALAGSQGVASPLVFDPGQKNPVVPVSVYSNDAELKMRGGLPNFFAKARAGKPLTIAYMGGSVTQMDNKYRNQSARYISAMLPGNRLTFINAGVSGTGTDLGACRLADQVLRYHPDLVFVEFAVNGAYVPGLEGIIRQIIKNDRHTDICLLYSVMSGQETGYAKGLIPEEVSRMEKAAEYYQLPAIYLGLEPSALVASGQWLFKGATPVIDGKPVFSDGIHPTEAGGYIYASAIDRSLKKMQGKANGKAHALVEPMLPDNWGDARMLTPDQVHFTGKWNKVKPETNDHLKAFAPWFPYIMQSEQPGASFSFTFEGDRFGIFDVGGPEVGQLQIMVDGKHVKPLNRFSHWCNNRYRGQFDFVETGYGKHQVTCTIDTLIPDKKVLLGVKQLADINANPGKYDHRFIYLGKILLKGNLVN